MTSDDEVLVLTLADFEEERDHVDSEGRRLSLEEQAAFKALHPR